MGRAMSDENFGCIFQVVVLVGIGAWFYFGHPLATLANIIWREHAAPWEQVDAAYYPSRHDLTVSETEFNVGSVRACRQWVYARAAANGDERMRVGDYECGIGPRPHYALGTIYRVTVQ